MSCEEAVREQRSKAGCMLLLQMLVELFTIPENSVAEPASVGTGTVPPQVQLHVALLCERPGA